MPTIVVDGWRNHRHRRHCHLEVLSLSEMSEFNSNNWNGNTMKENPLRSYGNNDNTDRQFQDDLVYWQQQDDLSPKLRQLCHALNTANMVNAPEQGDHQHLTPNKKALKDRLRRVDGWHHVSKSDKDSLKGQLCQHYANSKASFSQHCIMQDEPDKRTNRNGDPNVNKQLGVHQLQHSFSEPAVHKLLCHDHLSNVIRQNQFQSRTQQGVLHHHQQLLATPTEKLPGTTQSRLTTCPEGIWPNATTTSFSSLLEAYSVIPPCLAAVKSIPHKQAYIREYKCDQSCCPFRMRIVASDRTFYARKVVMQTLAEHEGHYPITWDKHYQEITENKKRSKKGLPKHIKDLVDIYADYSRQGPVAVWNDLCHQVRQLEELMSRSSLTVRQYIRQQVITRVKNHRSEVAKKESNSPPSKLEFTGDVVAFVEHYRLRLPPNFTAQPIMNEIHMFEIAHHLAQDGFLTTLRESNHVRIHRGMVTLKYDITDDHLLERVNMLMAKREKAFAQEHPNGKFVEATADNMVIFSSLECLRTICYCQKLDWKVCLSTDGTHDISQNDYRLLPIGAISVSRHGIRSFHPIVFAWCSGELELCVIHAIHHMIKACQELFDVTPSFYACISDHSPTFVNAFKLFWPSTPNWICYPHIIRKFLINGEREHNGQYRNHLRENPNGWLEEVAAVDVRRLRQCRTPAMWDRGIQLVSAGWMMAGESLLRHIFFEQYVDNDKYNCWQQFRSSLPCCTPQQQSNESYFLITKGRPGMEGTIKKGRPFSETVMKEFPKLVAHASQQRNGVERNNPMEQKRWLLGKTELLEYYSMIDLDVDVIKYQGGHLVNAKSLVGKPINGLRTVQYEDTLSGKFDGTHEDRDHYFDRALSLCHVTVGDSKKQVLQGSCWHFWDKGWCLHTAALQCRSELSVVARPTMTKKKSTSKRVARGDEDRKRFREQVRENKKNAIESTFLEEVAAIKESNKDKIHLINRVLNGATVIGGEEPPTVDDNPSDSHRVNLVRKRKNLNRSSNHGAPTSLGESPQPKRMNKQQVIDLSNDTSLSQSGMTNLTNLRIPKLPKGPFSTNGDPTIHDQGQAVFECTSVPSSHLDMVRQTETLFNRCSLLPPHVARSNEVPCPQAVAGTIRIPSSSAHPGGDHLLNVHHSNSVPSAATEAGDHMLNRVLSRSVHCATYTNNGNASSAGIALNRLPQGSNFTGGDVTPDQRNGQLLPFQLFR